MTGGKSSDFMESLLASNTSSAMGRGSFSPYNERCPDNDRLPTIDEFNSGLGDYAIGLYVYSGVTVATLALQFGFLVGHFINNVPYERFSSTIWVNSVFLVVSIMSLVSVVLPATTKFVWFVYQIYVTIAMGQFVDLTMSWYGGEAGMLMKIGEEEKISFRNRQWRASRTIAIDLS